MNTERSPDIGFLVFSCDRYADLWEPYFSSFFDQWPDCPFPVYLATNERVFEHPRVRSLRSGPDADWSSSILATLKQLPHKHVLTLFEDFFFLDRVSTPTFIALADWAIAHKARYMRLRPSPPPDRATDHPAIGLVRRGALYRGSLVFGLWDKAYLQSLLTPGESAWSFEVESSKRTSGDDGFYATYRDTFTYLHGVEKGLWFPAALQEMQRRGYLTSQPARGVWTRKQLFARRLSAGFRDFARRALPSAMRPDAHKLLWRWYRWSGKVR